MIAIACHKTPYVLEYGLHTSRITCAPNRFRKKQADIFSNDYKNIHRTVFLIVINDFCCDALAASMAAPTQPADHAAISIEMSPSGESNTAVDLLPFVIRPRDPFDRIERQSAYEFIYYSSGASNALTL